MIASPVSSLAATQPTVALLPLTPSQTIGPFYHDCLLRPDAERHILTGPDTPGRRIRIEGRIFDGDHAEVPDALVEIWQADSQGRCAYAPPLPPVEAAKPFPDGGADSFNPEPTATVLAAAPSPFLGYGRSGTGAAVGYWFETIKPGPVPFDPARRQAPHICVAVFARGLLNHLFTRLYFADEPANTTDPILQCVAPARRATLLAHPQPVADAVAQCGANTPVCLPSTLHSPAIAVVLYKFDIILQGPNETVFFNY